MRMRLRSSLVSRVWVVAEVVGAVGMSLGTVPMSGGSLSLLPAMLDDMLVILLVLGVWRWRSIKDGGSTVFDYRTESRCLVTSAGNLT